jgi:histidinol-phosphate aminotransferase
MNDDSWLTQRLQQLKTEKYVVNVDTIPGENFLRLNANENLLFPQNILSQAITETLKEVDLRTYPRIEEKQLHQTLSTYYSLPPNYFVINNGSDPLIESCVKALLQSQEQVISITPTFSMFKIISKNEGHNYLEVPLNQDFSLNVDAILSKATPTTHLCFINSPNNPTGNQFPIQDIRKLLTHFDGVVVVDEAYVEFASYTLKELIEEYDNLVLLRTFSKAFGIAGLRIGYSIANTKITNALKSVQLPYNINKVSLTLARKLLHRPKLIQTILQQIKQARTTLYKNMCSIRGVTAYASETNFILFQTNNTEQTFQSLLNQNILVRKFHNILDRGCFLRVTIGTPTMNKLFLNALHTASEN